MITLNLNLSKIDKDKLFKGEKGVYLDVVLFETPENEYGNDYIAVQGTTKEEREAGVKGAILGNGKIVVKTSGPLDEAEKDNLPF